MSEGGVEPPSLLQDYALNVARLPIPPLRPNSLYSIKKYRIVNGTAPLVFRFLSVSKLGIQSGNGAVLAHPDDITQNR